MVYIRSGSAVSWALKNIFEKVLYILYSMCYDITVARDSQAAPTGGRLCGTPVVEGGMLMDNNTVLILILVLALIVVIKK